jgi:hypothetical protein
VHFNSPAPLLAGRPFEALLLRGLVFRLSPTWDISVGPVFEPTQNYLSVVSPPLRTAPHLMIGAGYGLTTRESVGLARPLRFVLTRAEYDAALSAIERHSPEQTLKQLQQLGRGSLTLDITHHELTAVYRSGGVSLERLASIDFKGKACFPRS